MVIRFDLSSITDISLIDSVKLAFFSIGAKGENSCSLFVVTNDWDSDATWNNRKSGTAWNQVGGDYDQQSLVQVDVPDYYENWEEFDVTSHIMDMLNGNINNFGFLVKVDYCSTTDYENWRQLASSEYSVQALRPKLVFYADEFPDIDPPDINITSPDGGNLIPSTTHTITWTAVDDVGVIARSIYFSSNNGSSWTIVDSALGNAGTFPWSVPALSNSACKIMMYAYDLAGNRGGDTTRTFSIGDDQDPNIDIVTPTPGEKIDQNTSYTITWDATDNGAIASRSIYCRLGSSAEFVLADSAQGNTGSYEWTAPDQVLTNCKFKVIVYDLAGNSDYDMVTFHLEDAKPPVINILKPTPGESVKQGRTYTVTWEMTDNVVVMSRAVHFSSDGGSSWECIDSTGGNHPQKQWNVPVIESANCRIKVNAYDMVGNMGTSTTELFSIIDGTAPQVTIITPAAGEIVAFGSRYTITWTAENRPGVVERSIYFSADGSTWTLVDSTAGNTGTFAWTVPTLVSNTCKVKIYAYDGSGNQGIGMSGVFNIVDLEAPVVTIKTPTAGENLQQAAAYDITWTATDNIEVASRAIYFSSDSGTTWTLVDSTTENSGTFAWTVPNVESAKCLVQIFAYDPSGNVGSQESGVFTIEAPTGIIPNAFKMKGLRYQVTVTNLQGRVVASFETTDINNLSQIRNTLSSGVHIINIASQQGKSVCVRRCLIK